MPCLGNTGLVLSPVSGQGQHTVLLRKPQSFWHRFFGLNSFCLKPSIVFTKQKIFSSISCSYSSRPLEEAPEAARQAGPQPGINSRWLFRCPTGWRPGTLPGGHPGCQQPPGGDFADLPLPITLVPYQHPRPFRPRRTLGQGRACSSVHSQISNACSLHGFSHLQQQQSKAVRILPYCTSRGKNVV